MMNQEQGEINLIKISFNPVFPLQKLEVYLN